MPAYPYGNEGKKKNSLCPFPVCEPPPPVESKNIGTAVYGAVPTESASRTVRPRPSETVRAGWLATVRVGSLASPWIRVDSPWIVHTPASCI